MQHSGRINLVGATALAATLAASPLAAQDAPFASAAVKGPLSAARLLSAGAPQNGAYRAGLEIALEPGTVTYWRTPGDAGAPPQLDFSGSENLKSAETLYPAPKHIEEAGSVVAGYDATVIFPLRIVPRDPKAPVVLKLALNYAACAKICLPARAQLTLSLPQSGASPFKDAIAAAEAAAPKKLTPAEARQKFDVVRAGNGWRLTPRGGRIVDLFAEVPEPLYLDAKRVGEAFELKLVQGEKPATGVAATVTLLTDTEAVEAPLLLE